MQHMPTGDYVRCKAGFKPVQPDVFGKTTSEWTEWIAYLAETCIKNKYNSKE